MKYFHPALYIALFLDAGFMHSFFGGLAGFLKASDLPHTKDELSQVFATTLGLLLVQVWREYRNRVLVSRQVKKEVSEAGASGALTQLVLPVATAQAVPPVPVVEETVAP